MGFEQKVKTTLHCCDAAEHSHACLQGKTLVRLSTRRQLHRLSASMLPERPHAFLKLHEFCLAALLHMVQQAQTLGRTNGGAACSDGRQTMQVAAMLLVVRETRGSQHEVQCASIQDHVTACEDAVSM